MLSIVVYEDNKEIFAYGSDIIPDVGEDMFFDNSYYKVLSRTHIISKNLYREDICSKNYLNKIKLDVIEIE